MNEHGEAQDTCFPLPPPSIGRSHRRVQREYRQAGGAIESGREEEPLSRLGTRVKFKQDVARDGVAGAVQPHGHFNQLIMHEGQIKSDGQCCYRRRDAWTLSHARILCCLPGIITVVVIVRWPTQIWDGRGWASSGRTPWGGATDPIASQLLALAEAQHAVSQSVCCFKLACLYLNQVPTRPPPAPSSRPLQPSSTRPHSKAGSPSSRPKQNARPPPAGAH